MLPFGGEWVGDGNVGCNNLGGVVWEVGDGVEAEVRVGFDYLVFSANSSLVETLQFATPSRSNPCGHYTRLTVIKFKNRIPP